MSGKRYRVSTRSLGVVHFLAMCKDCNWTYEELDSKRGRREIRKHVRETGHTVLLETAKATHYLREDEAA